MRRFPPPWTVEKIPGGFRILDANQRSLAYVYSRETLSDAQIAKVLTEDEARRIASNIAKLPALRIGLSAAPLDDVRGLPRSLTPGRFAVGRAVKASATFS